MLAITWQDISGGQILIVSGIVALALGLWKASPIGSDAVESWKSLAEGRWEELKDSREAHAQQLEAINKLQEQVHGRELDIEKQNTIIAALEERPDTKTMLDTFERHHEENQSVLQTVIENQSEMIDGLRILIDRHRDRRSTDSDS